MAHNTRAGQTIAGANFLVAAWNWLLSSLAVLGVATYSQHYFILVLVVWNWQLHACMNERMSELTNE